MKETSEKFDIITVGDSTIDTFIRIHDATVECDINQEECKICLRYGDKIPVDEIGYGVAGNAANVAAACTKLGLKTAIYTNLGDDQTGLRIKKGLIDLGIHQNFIEVHKNKKSNLSVIINFQGERTALVYHQDWDYQLPKFSDCSWMYFTSVSQSFTETNIVDEVCHYVDAKKCKFAYSPGTYQIKADVKRFPKLLEKCDLFVVNLEETKKILDIPLKEKVEIKDLLSKLLLLGPTNVIVTDGVEGSYGSDGQSNFKVGILPVHIYEKTGAGDSYTGGVISGLQYGLSLGEAMVWGTHNSASTIQKLGPQNGLLTKSEIERNVRTIKDLVASTF